MSLMLFQSNSVDEDDDSTSKPLENSSRELDLSSDLDLEEESSHHLPFVEVFEKNPAQKLSQIIQTDQNVLDMIESDFNDQSDSTESDSELDLSSEDENETETNSTFEVRPYQQEISKNIIERKSNSIVFLETGSGKTIISILVIAHFLKTQPLKKILFLANTQNLVEQQKLQIKNTLQKIMRIKEYRLNYEDTIFSIHGEKNRKNKKWTLNKNRYEFLKILIISPQTFLNMLRRNQVSLKDFSLLIFDECHHTQGFHPYNQIMQEFYFHNLNQKEKPRVLGLTASPVLSINQNVDFNKIKESFKNLEKNLDSTFLEIDKTSIPSNTSETRIIAYENDESIRKRLYEDKDLLEVAMTSGFSKFFENIQIEDFNFLKNLKDITKAVSEKNRIQTKAMEIVYKAAIKLVYETSLIIILELGKYPFYCHAKKFKEELETVKHSDTYQFLKSEEKELLSLLENLFDQLLKDIGYMNNPDFISTKFKRLIEILGNSNSTQLNEEKKNQRTMVFTETRLIARLLSKLVDDHGKEFGLKTIYITGKADETVKMGGNKDSESIATVEEISFQLENLNIEPNRGNNIMNEKKNTKLIQMHFSEPAITIEEQMTAVESFREGKYNVLISTSVTEEGFDTPACNVVVAFDAPDSLKSYIQMKGRARQKNSTFFILAHKSKKEEWDHRISEFEGAVEVMKNFAYMPFANRNSSTETKPPASKKLWLTKKPENAKKEDENYQFFVTKQGCTVNTNWSVELLALFCAKFQSEDLINVSPKYHYLKIPSLGYLCCIILPPIFKDSLRMVKGGFSSTKTDAKKLAAYKCCQKLYENNWLSENLKAKYSDVKMIEKLQLERIFDFSDVKDPLILKKLEKIMVVKSKELKPRILYPLTTFNPFQLSYQEDKEKFIGYVYKLEFSLDLADNLTKKLPQTFTLAFVYFNENLKEAKVKVDLPFDDKAKVEFKLLKKYSFDKASYEKHLLISRFMDATIRSWDVNFFEMLLKQSTNTKNLSRRRKNLPGVEMNDIFDIQGKPCFPFYLILDTENNIAERSLETILNFLKKMEKRYHELNHFSDKGKKISIDTEYFKNFQKDPENVSKLLVQSYLDFNKYIVDSFKPIQGIDLLECKTDEMSLQMRIISIIEPNYDYRVQNDDYVLTMKSLGRYSQKLIKGEDHLNVKDRKAFKKNTFGVLGEFVEFPLEIATLMQLHQFKLALSNVRDYLRVVHFKNNILLKLENPSVEVHERIPWEFADTSKFDVNLDALSRIIEENEVYKENDDSSDAIMDLIENIETSSKFNDTVNYQETQKLEDISIDSIRIALTTKEYNNQENYDRREMLGDAILKLLSSIEVFAKNPTAEEYELHIERTKIINNLNLFRHSLRHDLYQFILKKKKEEQPISYTKEEAGLEFKVIEDEEEEKENSSLNQNTEISATKIVSVLNTTEIGGEGHKEGSVKMVPPNYEELHYKTVADVIESLVAVYYSHGGLAAAQKFLFNIGVLKCPDYMYNFTNKPDTKILEMSSARKMKNFLEKKLDNGKIYKFKDVNLLIQAFTHISAKFKLQALYNPQTSVEKNKSSIEPTKVDESEELTDSDPKKFDNLMEKLKKSLSSNLSYERLEFLGDSILDYYVVKLLYEKYPYADSGQLTTMKSSVVNNHALSLICVKNELDKLIISDSSSYINIASKIRENFQTYFEDIEKYVDSYSYSFIKVTGDIIESLIGAVYLDSKQNLEITCQVIKYLCGEMIDKYSEEGSWKNSARNLFNEYCKEMGYSAPTVRKLEGSEVENRSGFGVYVLEVDGNVQADYVAHTTSTLMIERKLYATAWKKVKEQKRRGN